MHTAEKLRRCFTTSRNLAIVFEHVIGGATSRIEVAQLSGLDRASVTRAVGKLVEWGLIHEKPSTQQQPTGRPRVHLETNDDYWIVGVHVGVHSVAVMRMGIGGKTYSRHEAAHNRSVESVTRTIVNLIERIRAETPLEPLGIGIAIGGWVDPHTQKIVRAPSFGWDHVDLRTKIENVTELPTELRPMARAHAQANILFGLVKRKETFGHLYVGSIVEYAFAHQGIVWWYGSGSGGLLENMPLIVADGSCSVVKDAVSDEGVVEQARRQKLLDESASFEDLLATVARKGPHHCDLQALLDERADNVGRLICQIQEVISVPTIVLSAAMMRQPNAIARVQSLLNAQSHTIAAPTIIGGGPIISATSQATAASLITSILNPAI